MSDSYQRAQECRFTQYQHKTTEDYRLLNALQASTKSMRLHATLFQGFTKTH
jgi:hypothetical protein